MKQPLAFYDAEGTGDFDETDVEMLRLFREQGIPPESLVDAMLRMQYADWLESSREDSAHTPIAPLKRRGGGRATAQRFCLVSAAVTR